MRVGPILFEGFRGFISLGILVLAALLLWPVSLGLFVWYRGKGRRRRSRGRLALLAAVLLLLFVLLWVFWLTVLSSDRKGPFSYSFIEVTPPSLGAWSQKVPAVFSAISPVRLASAFQSVRQQPTEFLVIEVIDGNTIKLENGAIVRYLGVNIEDDLECLSISAEAKNKDLVLGKRVRLEADPQLAQGTDSDGRLLRYVYVGDTLINEVLVREGFASASLDSIKEQQYHERLRGAEQGARDDKWGVWSDECVEEEPETTKKPVRVRRRVSTSTSPAAGASEDKSSDTATTDAAPSSSPVVTPAPTSSAKPASSPTGTTAAGAKQTSQNQPAQTRTSDTVAPAVQPTPLPTTAVTHDTNEPEPSDVPQPSPDVELSPEIEEAPEILSTPTP